MARSPIKETVKRATIADMKKLGIYKPEYNRLIGIYSGIVEEFEIINKRYVEGNYKFQESTAAGDYKKSPIVATLEALRKDILTYSDRLGLNPKALETITIEKSKKSKLAQVLSELK